MTKPEGGSQDPAKEVIATLRKQLMAAQQRAGTLSDDDLNMAYYVADRSIGGLKLLPDKEKEAFSELAKELDSINKKIIRGEKIDFSYLEEEIRHGFAMQALLGTKAGAQAVVKWLYDVCAAFANYLGVLGVKVSQAPVVEDLSSKTADTTTTTTTTHSGESYSEKRLPDDEGHNLDLDGDDLLVDIEEEEPRGPRM